MSTLHELSPSRRRRLGVMLLPAGLALLVIGLLGAFAAPGLAWTLVGGVVTLLAVVVLGIVLGLYRSAREDETRAAALVAEAALDAALIEASGPGCGGDCDSCDAAGDCAVKALPRL